MKKIRSIKHLETEKKKLRNRQEELENKFSHDWEDIKHTLRPKNIASDIFQSWIDKKTNDLANSKGLLQSTLSFGASLVAKRFAKKAEEKIDRLFKRS